MIKNSLFQNTEWLYPVILIAIIVWLVFVWKERLKYPSFKFYINIFVSFIAVVVLALLVLKPLKFSATKPFQAIILTSDFKQEQLDSLQKKYDNAIRYKYNPGQQVLDISNVPESAFILGHGIKPFDLWQFNSIKTIYLGGKELKGVSHLNHNKRNKLGDRMVIKGRYLNATEGQKLILENPGGKVIDSTILSSEKEQEFELSADLKAAGKFVYQLVEKDSQESLISLNPLPIAVSNDNTLNVLVLNDFPTFETKYLKNYLASKGHRVLIRSQLTKDRYKYEYFNMTSKPRIRLTRKGLNKFDLLLIDANTLNVLSRSKRNAIETSVREDGLGLFIQPDLSLFNSRNKLTPFRFNTDKRVFATLKTWPKAKITTYPYAFKKEFTLQPIQVSNTRVVSAYKQLGLGRIGTFVFQNTYALQLNGNYKTYQNLWTKIIESLSKKNTLTATWHSNSLFSFQNEPFHFTLSTSTELPSVLNNDGIKIPLKQHPDLESSWFGSTYPKKTGWGKLQMEQDTSVVLNYYVADSTSWQSVKAYQTIAENKRRFSDSRQISNGNNIVAKPIGLYWLFILFILCMGYLWLEPKL